MKHQRRKRFLTLYGEAMLAILAIGALIMLLMFWGGR